MNNIRDIVNGGISAILIFSGYLVLWCCIICLIMSVTDMPDDASDVRWCGIMCLVFTGILIGSGIAWYRIIKPKFSS